MKPAQTASNPTAIAHRQQLYLQVQPESADEECQRLLNSIPLFKEVVLVHGFDPEYGLSLDVFDSRPYSEENENSDFIHLCLASKLDDYDHLELLSALGIQLSSEQQEKIVLREAY